MKISKYSNKVTRAGKRDPKYPELLDFNMMYAREHQNSDYTEESAYPVFLQRIYNQWCMKRFRKKYSPTEFQNSPDALPFIEKAHLLLNEPDVDDLIPKKFWRNFQSFAGYGIERLYDPHIRIAFEVSLERMLSIKNRPKVLVVVRCSSSKPYSKMQVIQQWVRFARETRLFDLVSLSILPVFMVPYDASAKYPFIAYDWCHKNSPGINYLYEMGGLDALLRVIKVLGYEKVIFQHYYNFKHLNLLRGWGFCDFLDFGYSGCYAGLHRAIYGPKMAYSRAYQTYAGALWFADMFGDIAKKYLGKTTLKFKGVGWEYVSDELKKAANYPEGLITEPIFNTNQSIWR